MLASKKTKRGVIGAVVLAGVLALSGYALTDVMTIPTDSHSADGSNPVESVVASAFHYTLNATDPSKVDSISFDVDKVIASGGAVWVQPVGAAYPTAPGAQVTPGGTSQLSFWYACTAPDGTITHFSCDTTTGATPAPSAALAAADVGQVRVVAAD